MLEEKTHLPAILQSLGCIAQTALPVFETREDEIVGFIRSKILESSNVCLFSSKLTEPCMHFSGFQQYDRYY